MSKRMNITRPDPDQLLADIKQQMQQQQRGSLKIFFGSAAGVGKTYAMLQDAKRHQAEGRRVLVGVLETHGRVDTSAQLQGLECLPLQQIQHHNYQSKKEWLEFDLDAALAAKPDILLVDELAHTNIKGSRHEKRWQDVEELINAGINVYTTLNVQHLSSLNDVVNQVTGITVRETLPDSVFDQADEVVLVDTPPDELLIRLSRGKIYHAEQAKRASQHFFRKGNLIALRELALRRTADRVDAQGRDYRLGQNIVNVWQTSDRLLLCIGYSGDLDSLVRRTARLANALRCEWRVLCVETPRHRHQSTIKKQAVLQALRLAEQLGASTYIESATSVQAGILNYCHKQNIARVVIGHRQVLGMFKNRLITQLAHHNAQLELILLSHKKAQYSASLMQSSNSSNLNDPSRKNLNMKKFGLSNAATGYVWAVVGCALVTVLLSGLVKWFDLANVVMVYLLVVLLVSVKYGRGAGSFSACLAVLSFDFFFVEPRLSLSVSDTQYFLTFAVMLVVALTLAQLSSHLKFQANIASLGEQRANQQAAYSQALSAALTNEHIGKLAAEHLQRVFQCEVHIVLADLNEQLYDLVSSSHNIKQLFDAQVATWVYQHESEAGINTNTLAASPLLYRPLRAPMRTRGVIAILPNDSNLFFQPEQQRLLDTFLSQTALAIERVHFVEVAQTALVKVEGERLRGTLLSALSHDIRTPVTALVGLASRLNQPELSPYEQQQITQDIQDRSHAIQSLVINLLDMAKLQSGGLTLNKKWVALEEIIGSALRQVQDRSQQHIINTHIPSSMPLVFVDELILERVLVNLLDNALKYTPAQTPIDIVADVQSQGWIQLSVADQGDGVPEAMREKIFERFTRGEKESNNTGIGLGLALCREMLIAHGGTLFAEANIPQGLRLILRWQQPNQPELPAIEAEL
jgi:two-component system sensor histidine kinase KdpD